MKDDHARGLREGAAALAPGAAVRVHDPSVFEGEGMRLALLEVDGRQRLMVESRGSAARPFEKERQLAGDGVTLSLCPLSPANAEALRLAAPFTAPSALGGSAVTIGLGDRLGHAGPGHLRAVRRFQASPVLAQQSPRELTLTSRTFQEVLDAATWAVFGEGYRGPWGADGDHVKSESQVESALAAGFTMVTADVSDSLHPQWAEKGEAEVSAAYQRLDPSYRLGIEARYEGKAFPLGSGEPLRFTRLELERTVLVYRDALDHAERLFRAAASRARNRRFDFELSIDETGSPTTPQAHFFIAAEAKRRGIRLTSLAPRFVGDFEKSIDYIGSVAGFERDFTAHAALADTQGYRLSIHSGSDKFSLYPAIGRRSGGRFHIKTSGTSWLEALRVIAASDHDLFKDVYRAGRAGYDTASRLYHVTPDLSGLPRPDELSSESMPGLLDDRDARRVLHITYGEILGDAPLRERIFQFLERSAPVYHAAVERHISRHLDSLGVPRVPQ